MPTIKAATTGFPELIAKFNGIPPKVRAGVSGSMTRAGSRIITKAQTFPAQPSRTRARTFNTYVRGIGSYPRSAFGGGKRLLRPGARAGKFGKVRFTSQQVEKKWRMTQTLSGKGLDVVIENTASYAVWLMGRGKQRSFHKQTGWPELEGLAEAELPQLVTDVNAVIAEAVKG